VLGRDGQARRGPGDGVRYPGREESVEPGEAGGPPSGGRQLVPTSDARGRAWPSAGGRPVAGSSAAVHLCAGPLWSGSLTVDC
jgi:hypothetical protein